ncbi:MAG: hypothetical protein NZ744_02365, partial [Pirellulaceae bacterium]|nr:hypothetical protein [Pirellulaceae bacterium]
ITFYKKSKITFWDFTAIYAFLRIPISINVRVSRETLFLLSVFLLTQTVSRETPIVSAPY